MYQLTQIDVLTLVFVAIFGLSALLVIAANHSPAIAKMFTGQ
jgi:hypothetical protein